MAKQLGESSDPKQLIPGSAEAVETDAQSLATWSSSMAGIGEGLKRVDVGTWFGAASSAFSESFFEQPLKWIKASAAITIAAGALDRYAATLRWAQAQAREAIEVWKEGDRATGDAKLAHATVVAGLPDDAAVPSFSDPGEKQRELAQHLLNEARTQLAEAAEDAVKTIAGPDAVTSHAVTGAKTLGKDAASIMFEAVTGWETDGHASANGPKKAKEYVSPGFGKLGMLKAYAETFHLKADGTVSKGSLELSGVTDAYGGSRLAGSAGITDKGAAFDAEASSGLRALAEGRVSVGPASYYERAGGFVGVEGTANFGAGPEGIYAGASAFAGAKANFAQGADVGGIGFGVTGEVSAGMGADGKVIYGVGEDGKFHLGTDAHGTLGIGGGAGLEITVDPQKVTDTAHDAADVAGDTVDGVVKGVGSIKDGFTGMF
ncbi:putative T7SS-secreted protein [Streptomyces reniochalinae]|uniref:putative T7SS-secreted protein n=1 Tax=Streptomyces reniochalinae TaxID=2250578 RepID=UPI0011C06450|nr:hypothetical protein [Streptomyces reniochalinae]